jgi:hypothetical protein
MAAARWVLPLPINEGLVRDLATGNFLHQQRNAILIGGRASKVEVGEILSEREFCDRELVLDRPRILFGDLCLQKIADDCMNCMLPFNTGSKDLVEHSAHAVKLQLSHTVHDLMPFHYPTLRRSS